MYKNVTLPVDLNIYLLCLFVIEFLYKILFSDFKKSIIYNKTVATIHLSITYYLKDNSVCRTGRFLLINLLIQWVCDVQQQYIFLLNDQRDDTTNHFIIHCPIPIKIGKW